MRSTFSIFLQPYENLYHYPDGYTGMARDKKRLPSARKFITGNESKAFIKVFKLLSASSDGEIEVEDYQLKFVYCEIKAQEKSELDLIEDEPDSLEGLYSMSFDLSSKEAGKMGEIVFYRDSVHLTDTSLENLSIFSLDNKKVERLMMAILQA